MNLNDNFKTKCPVRYNADGTYWYCSKQLNEKQPVENTTCNFSKCPGRQLTDEEEEQRLLDLESRIVKSNKKKKASKDPLDILLEKIQKEAIRLEQPRCNILLSNEGQKWFCKKNMDIKMDITDEYCYYDDCPGRKLTWDEEKALNEKTRRLYERSEQIKKEIDRKKKPKVLKAKVEEPVIVEEPIIVEEPVIIEETTVEESIIVGTIKKCEWHKCSNTFEVTAKKTKFCCKEHQKLNSSYIYRLKKKGKEVSLIREEKKDIRICENTACGKSFEMGKNVKQKFCSVKCQRKIASQKFRLNQKNASLPID